MYNAVLEKRQDKFNPAAKFCKSFHVEFCVRNRFSVQSDDSQLARFVERRSFFNVLAVKGKQNFHIFLSFACSKTQLEI